MSTATATVTGPTRPAAAALPGTVEIGLARGAAELRMFFRAKEAVIFTFAFPAFLLVLLGSITGGGDGAPVPHTQVLAASMIAYGVLSTAFMGVGVGIAADREDGTLKRLRGTPITASAYFLGKIILVAVTSIAEVVLVLLVGVLVFDLPLPTEPGRWLTFAWVFALSVVACTLLGIAASGIARSARTVTAVLNLPVIALQFVSGVFVSISALPPVMARIAAVFPVRWMGQGFRSVFLPDTMVSGEVAGSWEHGATALVLGAWCAGGLLLCLATFRWSDRRSG